MQGVDYGALGARIQNARLRLGLNQGELAKAAGISIALLSQIERGGRRASVDTLVSIARVLEVRVEELLRDSLPEGEQAYDWSDVQAHLDAIRGSLRALEAAYRNALWRP